MEVGVFGFGVPFGMFHALGVAPRDLTLLNAPEGSPVDCFIEAFMDPFATAVLRSLSTGTLDDLDLLVFLRESPGAVHAFHYACEFRSRGFLPTSAPDLHLLNIIPSNEPAVARFNQAEAARLVDKLITTSGSVEVSGDGWADRFEAVYRLQSEGRIAGETAFQERLEISRGGGNEVQACPPAKGPRLALLGAPLGNAALHKRLDQMGALVFDQQAADQRLAARGVGLDLALAAQATNPFGARQPRPLYLRALEETLTAHSVDVVFWQVDTHDDLWGWLTPQLRKLCRDHGMGFTDLGFLPRWPTNSDLGVLNAL